MWHEAPADVLCCIGSVAGAWLAPGSGVCSLESVCRGWKGAVCVDRRLMRQKRLQCVRLSMKGGERVDVPSELKGAFMLVSAPVGLMGAIKRCPDEARRVSAELDLLDALEDGTLELEECDLSDCQLILSAVSHRRAAVVELALERFPTISVVSRLAFNDSQQKVIQDMPFDREALMEAVRQGKSGERMLSAMLGCILRHPNPWMYTFCVQDLVVYAARIRRYESLGILREHMMRVALPEASTDYVVAEVIGAAHAGDADRFIRRLDNADADSPELCTKCLWSAVKANLPALAVECLRRMPRGMRLERMVGGVITRHDHVAVLSAVLDVFSDEVDTASLAGWMTRAVHEDAPECTALLLRAYDGRWDNGLGGGGDRHAMLSVVWRTAHGACLGVLQKWRSDRRRSRGQPARPRPGASP